VSGFKRLALTGQVGVEKTRICVARKGVFQKMRLGQIIGSNHFSTAGLFYASKLALGSG
jgi:hypothetical protein